MQGREKLAQWDGATFDISEVNANVQRSVMRYRYERQTIDCLKALAPRRLPFVNFGACMGVVDCLHNMQMDNPNDHVAVEGNPDACKINEANRARNNCKYTILNRAVAYTPKVEFFVPDHTSELIMDGSVDDRFEAKGVAGRRVSMESISLERIVRERGWRNIALCVDIEGGEYDLVENEADLIAEVCDWMMIKWHYSEEPGDPDRDRAVAAKRALKKRMRFHREHSYARMSVLSRKPPKWKRALSKLPGLKQVMFRRGSTPASPSETKSRAQSARATPAAPAKPREPATATKQAAAAVPPPNPKPATNESGELISRNKWGQSAVKFADASPDRLAALRTVIGRVISAFETEGYDLTLGYGTLLGAVRDGAFIGHDDDVDLVLIAKSSHIDDIGPEVRDLALRLRKHGLAIAFRSYGAWDVRVKIDGKLIKIDVFVSWFQDDRYYLDFALMGTVAKDAILPLGRISFEGMHDLKIPGNPQALLAGLYGEGWRVPDPGFRYRISDESRAFFRRLNRDLTDNQQYWEKYYARKVDNTPWVQKPSQFAAFVSSELKGTELIAEVGCGNGRDSNYLASVGFRVRAFDYAKTAIEFCNEHRSLEHAERLKYAAMNFYNPLSIARSSETLAAKIDVVYSRFFLNAVTKHGEEQLLLWATRVLKPGGLFVAEFRTSKDPRKSKGKQLSTTESNDGHYRRFIVFDDLLRDLKGRGFNLEYAAEGASFAKLGDEDPVVGRVFARWVGGSARASTEPDGIESA